MDVREFMKCFQERYSDVDRYELAEHRDIRDFEDRLGVKLPLSFCTFLSEFSNGFFYLIVNLSAELARNRLVGQYVKVM
ncbi:SMI1/KNR4 family protein [Paenibacillus lautus]|uniref:SMI1/KNR4 family protein n=1 Tax=Paenibacillus lautus TaxID=1401 RepID=UPI003D9A1BB6